MEDVEQERLRETIERLHNEKQRNATATAVGFLVMLALTWGAGLFALYNDLGIVDYLRGIDVDLGEKIFLAILSSLIAWGSHRAVKDVHPPS